MRTRSIGVVPQRVAVGDNGTKEQSYRSGGDGCGKAVPDGSGSKGAVVPFKRCLVHFAVGNEKVSMTTHLQGGKTQFFPFNQGY